MSDIQLITRKLVDEVRARAQASARRRMNYNFHASAEDNPHRMLNILVRGTYIAPHRHRNPDKAESFLVLEGVAKVICFNDTGEPAQVHRLYAPGSGDIWGIDLAAGVWHTICAESEYAVCYEVKPGPWQAATDKEFAPWAPRENEPGWLDYLRYLEGL
jgi:cupin fold WbuC family metalloprotein